MDGQGRCEVIGLKRTMGTLPRLLLLLCRNGTPLRQRHVQPPRHVTTLPEDGLHPRTGAQRLHG